MLKAQLRKDIDLKWDSCWPVNSLRPLVIIDCITCLLFLKKLEDRKLITHEMRPGSRKLSYFNDCSELSWSYIKTLDPKELHTLIAKENGIADLLNSYGKTNLPYSSFLRAPMLINPSGVLLKNVIEIIKTIELESIDAQGSIFEYLLHKEKIYSDSGQVYLPKETMDSIIDILQPCDDEVICDPACGNGDFLVSAAAYLSNKYGKKRSNQFSKNIIGTDNDPIQMRIAAMNMILHGIEKPQLKDANAFKKMNFLLHEKPSLIISNLFYTNIETKQPATLLATESGRNDISLLKIILKNLEKGCRAAIIIRNYILNNNLPEIRLIRQQIVDEYDIDAVINLPANGDLNFEGASILIFKKTKDNGNDETRFYEWESSKSRTEITFKKSGVANEAYTIAHETALSDFDLNIKNRAALSQRFCVATEKIKSNNYILVGNHYKENFLTTNTNSFAKIISKEITQDFPKEAPALLLRSKVQVLLKTAKAFFSSKKAKYLLTINNTLNTKAKYLLKPKFNFVLNNSEQLFYKTKHFITDYVKTLLRSESRCFSTAGTSPLSKAKEQVQKYLSVKKQNFTNFYPLSNKAKAILIASAALTIYIVALFFMSSSGTPGKVEYGTKSLVPMQIKNAANPNKTIENGNGKRILTQQQIKAILKDTSGIIHFKDFSNNDVDPALNSKNIESTQENNYAAINNRDAPISRSPKKMIEKAKYTVIDTAYFHTLPVESAARKTYLDPLNKNVLTPIQDSNGYIYVDYTNKLRITSKGWINKKYLKQVQ